MRAQQPVKDAGQDPSTPAETKPPRSFSGLYLASWAVLGSVSATYIAVLLTQPEWATPLTTQSLPMETAPAIPPEVQQLTDEVGSLRKTLADLQRELDEVKSTAAAQPEPEPPLRPMTLETELARLNPEPQDPVEPPEAEANVAPEQAAAPEAPQPAATEAEAPAETAKPVPTETPPAKTEERKMEEPKAAAPAPSPAKASQLAPATAERGTHEQTPKPERKPTKKVVVLNARSGDAAGSAGGQPPAITFGPAIVTPAAEAVAIHLDAGPSLDALRLRWSVLRERHRSALRDLEPRYLVSGTARSPSYLLMAGPISTKEEASRICALLRARSVPCSVGGPFVGQAL